MIEVFQTNVPGRKEASVLLDVLTRLFPGFKINFDLEDCDKILRVEAAFFNPEDIRQVLVQYLYQCRLLPD